MKISLFICILLISAGATAGALYRWTDANGVTHYATQPPSGGQQQLHKVDKVPLPRQPNVVKADSKNQFVALAQLSALTLCRGRSANRQSCIDAQVAAAREVGRIADETVDPSRRFHIQTCQQRHLLNDRHPADFVALRHCVAGF